MYLMILYYIFNIYIYYVNLILILTILNINYDYILLKINKFILFFCQNIYYLDQEYCINNISSKPFLLKYIKNQTNEIIKLSLDKSHGRSIIYVKNKNIEIINYTIDLDIFNFTYLEEYDFAYNLCKKIILNQDIINPLKYIPYKFYKNELLKIAVRQFNDSLFYIHNQTTELCLLSVFYHPSSIKYVKNKTKDLCEIAVKKHCNALEYIPTVFINYNLCLIAIKKDPYVLKYVPKEIIDYKLCEISIKKSGNALQYVPNTLIDYNLCYLAVKNCINAFKFVPKNLIDYHLILLLLKNNRPNDDEIFIQKYNDVIKYIPHNLINYKYACLLVNNDGYNLKYIPKKIIDYNLCMIAVKNNKFALKYVPKHLINYELCFMAVSNEESSINNSNLIRSLSYKIINGITLNINLEETIINYVPNNLINYNLCSIALINNINEIYYIPTKYIDDNLIKIIINKHINYISIINENKLSQELKDLIIINYLENGNELSFDYDIINYFKNKVKKELDECPICGNKPEYFVSYKCHEKHVICLDCFKKYNKCYYHCNKGVNLENLFINN